MSKIVPNIIKGHIGDTGRRCEWIYPCRVWSTRKGIKGIDQLIEGPIGRNGKTIEDHRVELNKG